MCCCVDSHLALALRVVIVLQLRGGKSKASAKKRATSVASKRKAVSHDDDEDEEDDGNSFDEDEEDDEDDDEEEDDGYDDRRKRKGALRKGSKGRGRSGKRGHSQLVPWGSGKGSKSKASGILAGLVSQSRERLEDLAKQGQSAYKDVYRRAKVGRCVCERNASAACVPIVPPFLAPSVAVVLTLTLTLTLTLALTFNLTDGLKVLRSSAFEGMLLRATWPGNEAVPQDLLTEIIKHSIPAFKYGRAVRLRRQSCVLLRVCAVDASCPRPSHRITHVITVLTRR